MAAVRGFDVIETYNADETNIVAQSDGSQRVEPSNTSNRVNRILRDMGVITGAGGNPQFNGTVQRDGVHINQGIFCYQELSPSIIDRTSEYGLNNNARRGMGDFYQYPGYVYQRGAAADQTVNSYVLDLTLLPGNGGGGGICCMQQASWTTSGRNDMVGQLDRNATVNAIVWSPRFRFIQTVNPTYFDTDIDEGDPRNRLGCRSTPFVELEDTINGKRYHVISAHGPVNAKKRARFLQSICGDADGFANPIVAGDLNALPAEMDELLTPRLNNLISYASLRRNDNEYIVTHIKPPTTTTTEFRGRLDWIITSRNQEIVLGEEIGTAIGGAASDHRRVRVFASFDIDLVGGHQVNPSADPDNRGTATYIREMGNRRAQGGGNNYYAKYRLYKTKYLKLKNN